jgi:hypothetical protein
MVTEDYEAARAHAEEIGWRLHGTYRKDGTPVYFVLAPEAEDQEIHDKAFEIREGRPINEYEKWGIEVAKRLAGAEPELELSSS